MKRNILFTLGIVLSLSSCDNYLGVQPSASSYAPITSASQLISLMDYPYHTTETNYFQGYCNDDCEIPNELYLSRPNSFYKEAMCYYTFNSEAIEAQTSNYLWSGEYKKIFNANLVLAQASSVTGEKSDINEAVCNAHFMRAYSLFLLAQYYCLPYCEANKTSLGLPLRLGTDFEEPIGRATLQETYDQILADLNASESCQNDEVVSDYSWRVSKCAVYAMYSRVYLVMGDYEKALDYTNKAIALAPDLYDYNNLKWGISISYPAADNMPAQTLEYCETHSWYMKSIFKYQEWIYIRLQNLMTQWWVPSQKLVDSYEKENDLRFDFFFVEHGNRRFLAPYDTYRYDQFSDGECAISGLTTAELYLNKAELLARTNQWQDAIVTVNDFRKYRFRKGSVSDLSANSQREALKVVLEERRREMPFVSRLSDIKRFSVNETPDDDVTIVRKSFATTVSSVDVNSPIDIVIPGNSPKLAMPINGNEIKNSGNVILQNKFE